MRREALSFGQQPGSHPAGGLPFLARHLYRCQRVIDPRHQLDIGCRGGAMGGQKRGQVGSREPVTEVIGQDRLDLRCAGDGALRHERFEPVRLRECTAGKGAVAQLQGAEEGRRAHCQTRK